MPAHRAPALPDSQTTVRATKKGPFLRIPFFETSTVFQNGFRTLRQWSLILKTFTREQLSVTHRGVRALHPARKDLPDGMALYGTPERKLLYSERSDNENYSSAFVAITFLPR